MDREGVELGGGLMKALKEFSIKLLAWIETHLVTFFRGRDKTCYGWKGCSDHWGGGPLKRC